MSMDAQRNAQLQGQQFAAQQANQQMINGDIMGVGQAAGSMLAGAPSAPGGAAPQNAGQGPTMGNAAAAYGNQSSMYSDPNYFNNMMNGAGYSGTGTF